LELLGVL